MKKYAGTIAFISYNLQYDIQNVLDTVQWTGPLKEIKI